MIDFSEFMKIIPKSEHLELHIIESDNSHINLDPDEVEKGFTLNHKEYEYHVITVYTYYDKELGDSVIHALIAFTGEDNNA